MSPCGTQKALNICEKYGSDHDIVYNSKKSLTMLFKPKKLKDLKSPPLYSCKCDMRRHLCKVYANANMLITKFRFCSDDVKVCLFKSYCTNLYCIQFWCDSSATFMKNYL